MFSNTNTNAPSVNSLHGGNEWDSQSLKIFATAKRCTQSGSPCKTILSCSGDLETEASGADGYEITRTSFYTRGFE